MPRFDVIVDLEPNWEDGFRAYAETDVGGTLMVAVADYSRTTVRGVPTQENGARLRLMSPATARLLATALINAANDVEQRSTQAKTEEKG